MALTDHERHQLQQLAEQVLKDDPRLAAKLEGEAALTPSSGRVHRGGFALLVGLFVFAIAVSSRTPGLFVLGLTLIGSGVYLISSVFWLPAGNPGNRPADDG
jgi:uncharacterized membrane protein HdeD (DUF308 family)